MINQIFNEDCLETLKRMDSESVDLVVTDPPYLMNYRSNRRKEKFNHIENDVDSHGLIETYLAECYRVLKDNTAIYMFCSWHHVDFFKVEFEKHFKLKNIIVWVKNVHGTGDLEGSYAPKHELILYGHKGRSLLRENRIPDVIECAKVNPESMIHPTEKPVKLLETFIKNSSEKGDIVFDGFMGGGSTAIAAMNLERKFIGSELDNTYYEQCIKRTTYAYSYQLSLFDTL